MPKNLRDVADGLIETPIITSFTRIGFSARKQLENWTSLGSYDMTGRVVVLTGATSGIGRAAAVRLARCGATLVVVGRDSGRNQTAVDEITEATGNRNITEAAADMGDYGQVRALAERVLTDHDRLDVLVHNAGTLSASRGLAPDGTEATVASQVVGPFLLTGLLLERLASGAPSRVLTTSSGGMYAAALSASKLQMSERDYNGTQQYARAKRAQVTLNEMWAERFGHLGIHFHAMHPGWADTPGVDASLPTFAKVMGPLLRTADQGADTLVWLATDDAAVATNGRFWHDRRTRPIHKLPATRRSDTRQQRDALWRWVVDTCGLEPTIARD